VVLSTVSTSKSTGKKLPMSKTHQGKEPSGIFKNVAGDGESLQMNKLGLVNGRSCF
jgi:hypothetical protein